MFGITENKGRITSTPRLMKKELLLLELAVDGVDKSLELAAYGVDVSLELAVEG